MRRCRAFSTPTRPLFVVAEGTALVAAGFTEPSDVVHETSAVLDEAGAWLSAWLRGEARRLPALAPSGTPFQQAVWRAVAAIPCGETRSYQAIASAVERPRGAQAVGAANGANPLLVFVPCHRVVGADGELVGYRGGLHRKRWMLEHEGAIAQRSLF